MAIEVKRWRGKWAVVDGNTIRATYNSKPQAEIVAASLRQKPTTPSGARDTKAEYAARNARAQEMGYRSYAQRRLARKTGVGLQGEDLAAKRKATGLSKTTKAQQRPKKEPAPKKPSRLFNYEKNKAATEKELQGPMAQGPLGHLLRSFGAAQADINGIINRLAGRSVTQGLGDPTANTGPAHEGYLEIQNILKGNMENALEFIKNGLPGYFKAGLLAGAGAGGRALITRDRSDKIRGTQQQALGNMKRGLFGTDRTSRQTIQELRDAQTRKAAAGIINRNGARAVVYKDGRRMQYGDWASASMHALAARTYNEAFLDAAMENGATKFEIHDGDGCGLAEHDDPLKADGLIVDADTAQEYVIAHPHCVRTFDVYNGPKDPLGKHEIGSLVERVLTAALHLGEDIVIGSAIATATETLRTFVQQQGLDVTARQLVPAVTEPFMQEIEGRLNKVTFPDIIDINTGKPKIFTQAQLLEDMMSYSETFAEGNTSAIPQYMIHVLTGTDDASPVEINKRMDKLMSMMDRGIRSQLNIPGDFYGSVKAQGLKATLFDTWAQYSQSPNSYVRLGFPGITSYPGQRPGVRLNGSLLRKVTGNITRTLHEQRGNIAISPNAMIRAGIHADSLRGGFFNSISPSLRIKVWGPIRVQSTLNRATREQFNPATHQRVGRAGSILSISTKLSMVSPRHLLNDILPGTSDNTIISSMLSHLGFDFGATMRTDLRRLGLQRLRDVKDLKWADIQHLVRARAGDRDPLTGYTLGQSFNRLIDITGRIHLNGGHFFDFVNTARLKFENLDDQESARIMWRLGKIQLESTGSVAPRTPFRQQVFKTVTKLYQAPETAVQKAARIAKEARAGIRQPAVGPGPKAMKKARLELLKGGQPVDEFSLKDVKTGVVKFWQVVKGRANTVTAKFRNRNVNPINIMESALSDLLTSMPRLPALDVIVSHDLPDRTYGRWSKTYQEAAFVVDSKGDIVDRTSGTGKILISNTVVDDWKAHGVLRKGMSESGYVPKGAGAPEDTVIHEFGHHSTLMATPAQQKELQIRLMSAKVPGVREADAEQVEMLRKFDPPNMKNMFEDWMNGNAPALWKLVSTYSMTNANEFEAEVFLQMVKGTPNGYTAVMAQWLREVWG